MDVSRIFVKGLPPSYTEQEFRNHFAKRYNVTDIKLLPARRIGYVGFKTSQDAAAAVKYFNKSFIRMSRINVEFAVDSASMQSIQHPTSRSVSGAFASAVENTSDVSLKRKREDVPPKKDDAKFREYLSLKKKPATSSTWAQDASLDPVPAEPQSSKEAASGTSIGTSIKQATEQVVHKEKKQKPLVKEQIAVPDEAENVAEITEEPKEDRASKSAADGSNDMDWMRSRTSRLLGLVEDGSEEIEAGHEEPNQSPTPASGDIELAMEDVEPSKHPEPIGDDANEDVQMEAPAAEDANLIALRESGRLFLRNLSYNIAEADLQEAFSPFGPVQEVHVPLDPRTGQGKGFAFVQFSDAEHAIAAFEKLDGTVFQGRLLHVIPAVAKRENKLDEFALSKLPLKKQKQIQRKADASSSTFNWNSLYMNADAVLSAVADKLGVSKSDVLDPTDSSAAVKQAHAETNIISETKEYFKLNGVDLAAFSKKERGDTAILVKNFPYGTTSEEIRKLFEEQGDVSRVLMPPRGTIAIVEFKLVTHARAAFHTLAYRKFKDTVLFLEKAPKDLFTSPPQVATSVSAPAPKPSTSDLLQRSEDQEVIDTSSLYVRNLNFTTTNERFSDLFKPLDGFISARVSTKPDPKNPGQTLSMGFGFLEFRSAEQARAAQVAMNGFNLDGHQLVMKASRKAYDAAEESKKQDDAKKKKARKAKIIIKNLPFQASRKDITDLFKAYGQLKAVRVPKKFDSSRRGFAFAEFATPREAESALDALRDTHLLGRRLILDYAAGETDDPELEIEKLQQKVEKQTNNIALQRLTATERRKFDISGEDAEG